MKKLFRNIFLVLFAISFAFADSYDKDYEKDSFSTKCLYLESISEKSESSNCPFLSESSKLKNQCPNLSKGKLNGCPFISGETNKGKYQIKKKVLTK